MGALSVEMLTDLDQVLPLVDERLDEEGFLAAIVAHPDLGVFFRPHELNDLLKP